jgi:hypothetical protein
VVDVLLARRVPVVMALHDYKPVCPNYRLYTGNPTALAEAMAALACNPARAVELGRATRCRVAARHDPGGHTDALLDRYRRAMARAS